LSHEEKKGTQILAVSIDSHKESKSFIKYLTESFPGEFDFLLLEDKNHKVINRYGILNPSSPGWPHPATYVLDRSGVVRWRFIEVDYTKRATNVEILQALRQIP